MLFQRLFRPDKSLTLRGKCYIWNSWQKREDLELKIGKNHKKRHCPPKTSMSPAICCVPQWKMPTAAAHTHAQQTTMCLRHDTGLADLIAL